MNWDKIEQLLRIAEGSLKWGVPLRPIHDAAMKELHGHAHPPKPEAPKPEPVEEVEETESMPKRKLIDG